MGFGAKLSSFDRLGNEIAGIVDSVCVGRSTWSDVVTAVANAVPGSFAAIHNKNFSTLQLNSFVTHNLQPGFFQSYVDHYATVNPWIDYWSTVPPGKVAASEAVAPSNVYRDTEFYNDWMIPQGGIEAAAGVKIEADSGETVQMLLHYPVRHAAKYDVLAVRLLERLRGNLNRSVEFGRAVRFATEKAMSSAALVAASPRPAFVVAVGCLLMEANEAAERVFRSNNAVIVTGRRIRLTNPLANSAFMRAVTLLCQGAPTDISSISFGTADSRWHMSLTTIEPEAAICGMAPLLPTRRTVLVRIADLNVRESRQLDMPAAEKLFGLTPSERLLCERLLDGDSLSEAADGLIIERETARTRLKSIFDKTSTSRQAELILLLTRIARYR